MLKYDGLVGQLTPPSRFSLIIIIAWTSVVRQGFRSDHVLSKGLPLGPTTGESCLPPGSSFEGAVLLPSTTILLHAVEKPHYSLRGGQSPRLSRDIKTLLVGQGMTSFLNF